jgi:hypothetical protein
MYMCPIPNGFRDGAVSQCSCKIVYKKKILRTVSNTGIYCSSDKIGTGCLVQYISENSTLNISELCNSCEDMACCSSEFILTFLYAGDNIHYVIEHFVSCTHFSSVHFTLPSSNPINKNITGFGLAILVASSWYCQYRFAD